MRNLNLVLVDDDPSIVRLVTTILEHAVAGRVTLHGMTDPVAARKWIAHNRCDILLTDIEMPSIGGLEMLKFAKKRNAWTQVIFMTANSTWDHIAEAIESGASDYLLKPIDHAELVELVSQACARQERWQQAISETLKAASLT